MGGTVQQTDGGVVVLEHADLAAGKDLSAAVERAFGAGGLGLLVVRGVPEFVQLRAALLPLAFRFAALPDAVKERYVHAPSSYSFGWSHGKEILKPGQFDEFKGSYYNNPQYDVPQPDPELVRKYPENYHPNIWPSEDFPALRPAFMALGQRMVEAGLLVAVQCDRYGRAWATASGPTRCSRRSSATAARARRACSTTSPSTTTRRRARATRGAAGTTITARSPRSARPCTSTPSPARPRPRARTSRCRTPRPASTCAPATAPSAAWPSRATAWPSRWARARR